MRRSEGVLLLEEGEELGCCWGWGLGLGTGTGDGMGFSVELWEGLGPPALLGPLGPFTCGIHQTH
jgi:hypothetical protein